MDELTVGLLSFQKWEDFKVLFIPPSLELLEVMVLNRIWALLPLHVHTDSLQASWDLHLSVNSAIAKTDSVNVASEISVFQHSSSDRGTLPGQVLISKWFPSSRSVVQLCGHCSNLSELYHWETLHNGSLANLTHSLFFPQELRFPTQVASIRGFPKGQSSFGMCIGLQWIFVSRHTDFSLIWPPTPPLSLLETRALTENRSLFHHVCFGCLR